MSESSAAPRPSVAPRVDFGAKRLLLLGGGHAHVHVLEAFRRQPLAGAQALLVSPFARQTYSGMVPGLVAGHYTPGACSIPLAPLAAAAHVSLVESSAVALNVDARTVALADGRVAEYDVLSIDTGPVMDRDAIPGAREHGLFVRPIEHFVQLFEGLLTLAAQRALDVVVVGSGLGGVELALALAWRLRRLGGGSRVALVTGGGLPLTGSPPRFVQHGLHALKRLGVTVLQESCVAVEERHVVLANGARVACDAPVLAIGTSAPAWLAGSGLALDERGFVATGPTLQSVSHPNVFAAGDVATRTDAPHPKSGVHAVRAGPPLAANLRRFVGRGELLPYSPPARTLNLLSCGGRRAIVSWGGWSAEGRWLWWWKDRIDRAFVKRFSVGTGRSRGTQSGA
ncbi:MAG TPA: FAD-dependent oxidoreductase [Rubrivivax sp.]